MSQILEGTIDAQEAGAAFKLERAGKFNLTVSGEFTATLQVERSFDDGDAWHPCTAGGAAVEFTGPFSEVLEEPENGVSYRLNATAHSDGEIAFRFGG